MAHHTPEPTRGKERKGKEEEEKKNKKRRIEGRPRMRVVWLKAKSQKPKAKSQKPKAKSQKLPHSYASASIGSFCAALYAGYSAPKVAPTRAISVARSIQSLLWSICTSGQRCSMPTRAVRLTAMPTAIPASASRIVSRKITLTI